MKKSAIRGEILLIEGDDPGAMLEALEAEPAARDVAPFADAFAGERIDQVPEAAAP